jgi:hypothetical protein
VVSRRQHSADRLAELGYDASPAGLSRALQDGNVAVRAEAAGLLGEIDDDQVPIILERALADSSARVRVEAAAALAARGGRELADPVLHRELEGQLFADAPLRAARALATLGDPAGYPRVLEALHSELPSNRMEAIAVLPDFARFAGTELGGVVLDPVAALTEALDDPEELLRRDARQALDSL